MRVIIVGAGEAPGVELIKKHHTENTVIIAADGGANVLDSYGIVPNILMGDFDSISEQTLKTYENKCEEVRRFPVQKDETDLELCADKAVSMGADEILFMGVMGGRFDHAYASLLVLNRILDKCEKCAILHENQRMYLLSGRGEFCAKEGSMFSVMPFLGSCRYTVSGNVKYSAKNLVLEGNASIANSNETTDGKFSIEIEGKAIVCIME